MSIKTQNQKKDFMIKEANQVSLFSSFKWVYKGFEDFLYMPLISLFYGLSFMFATLTIMLFVQYQNSGFVILPSLILFIMMGPYLALGLYHASMKRNEGGNPNLWDSINAVRINTAQQSYFALMLGLFMILWTRVAAVLHALYPQVTNAPLEDYLVFLSIGSGIGLVFLIILFGMAAFSIPLMLDDEDSDVFSAVFSSFKAVNENKGAMIVWASIILVMTAIGVFTKGYGMVITMPILGYATWHGYKEVLKK